MYKILVIFCLIAGIHFSGFAQTDSVKAGKILRHLASDEMKGRALYSAELDSAAAFIAYEFKRSGLKTFENKNSYLQEFTIQSFVPTGLSGKLNEVPLSDQKVFPFFNGEAFTLGNTNGFIIDSIVKGENGIQKISELFKTKENRIVMLDTSFKRELRYLNYLKRNITTTPPNIIFISGIQPIESLQLNATQTIKTNKLANVVGYLPGKSKKDEFVVFSAHYDHVGIGRPVNVDSIYNGANDNAAGTTAIIMLADYFAKKKNNERSILFVGFTAEESGGFGSKHFSESVDPAKIAAMFNIEMIGTESKWGKNSAYITGFEKSDLGTILQKNLKETGFEFHPDPYPDQNLFYRSDNATLARLGVPAHTISTSKMDIEPHYHKPSDEVSTLDIKNMAAIIDAIALSSKSIVAGKDTPSRVKEEN